MTSADTQVRRNDEAQCYELIVNGQPCGTARYQEEGDCTIFTHTDVDPSLSGQGLGSRLASGALEDVRARNRGVVARCSFIAEYIARHPQWQDLLPDA